MADSLVKKTSAANSRLRTRCLRAIGAIAVAVCALASAPAAYAQYVAVIVNGEPITTYDIQQRSKLIQLQSKRTPSNQEVLEELISEKLKVQAGKRYKLELSDQDIDSSFADMAGRMRMNAQQLTQTLAGQGVSAYTLKDRIRAEMVWQQIVRGKYQASLQITEKEVASAVDARKKDETVNYEYKLQPILFVVTRGSGEDTIAIKKRDAEALRVRFENCDAGVRLARGLREVAVRDPITKNSADLPPALREILDKTQIGRLTEPEVTSLGVEMFAVCSKQESRAVTAAKREVQNEIYAQQFAAQSKRYLAELRKSAMIEYKDVPADAPPARTKSR